MQVQAKGITHLYEGMTKAEKSELHSASLKIEGREIEVAVRSRADGSGESTPAQVNASLRQDLGLSLNQTDKGLEIEIRGKSDKMFDVAFYLNGTNFYRTLRGDRGTVGGAQICGALLTALQENNYAPTIRSGPNDTATLIVPLKQLLR
jgi:hypothetical protein